MTPKEKAAELIVNYQLQCKSLDYQQAKECAVIAVDLLFKNNIGYDRDGVIYDEIIIDNEYWQEVKTEIEKL